MDQPYRTPKVRALEWSQAQVTHLEQALKTLKLITADLQAIKPGADTTTCAYIDHALVATRVLRDHLDAVLQPF